MSPQNIGGRLRRAASLALLVAALEGRAATALAQQTPENLPDGNVVVSDDNLPSPPGTPNYQNAPYENGAPDGQSYGPSDGNADGYNGSGPGCEDYGVCPQPAKRYFPIWVGAEWIHWRLDGGDKLPPLVTDGPANLPLTQVARLNDPNTRILAGDDFVNDDWRDGFRVYAGYWFDCCRTCGVGVDYFDVGDDDFDFLSENDPTRIVGRPFFNTETGLDDVEFVSIPGELDGTVHVNSGDSFRGAGITFNKCLWQCCDPCCGTAKELNGLAGYRFYEYDNDLVITENLTVLPGTQTPLVPGTTFFVQDSFRTHNEFNGGEIGLQGWMKRHCWWIDGMAKVAMGSQHRTVTVNGRTIINVPGGGTFDAPGGLLTSEITNIGRYDDSDFVVIPEFRVGVGRQLTPYCAVRAGYNLIYWGDVARAGNHLPPDLAVDPRNLPPIQQGGGPEPIFPGIRGSELIAHGLDVSIMFEF
jgi:hypothetical protein